MAIRGETMYYDRDFNNNLYRSGFNIIHDLTALYHMSSYLNKYNNLSKGAKQRLKWMDYYHQSGNASKTCRHFDIPRKTFYKWRKRFDPDNLYSLEDHDRAPINKRKREITPIQEQRIIDLRKKYIKYSKIKIAKIALPLWSDSVTRRVFWFF